MSYTLDNENTEIVLDSEEKITAWKDLEVQERLNEIDTFSLKVFDVPDEADITTGTNVLVFEDGEFEFKGRVEDPTKDNRSVISVEGEGMSSKLLDRKTNRDEYNSRPADEIAVDLIPGATISIGDVESAPETNLSFDHDNRARALASAANAVGYDWDIRQDAADDYQTDYLDFKKRIGSDSVVKTFTLGENARAVEEEDDEGGFLANDITLLGRGDGINQLEARVFAAAEEFTQLEEEIGEEQTSGDINVADTGVLGAAGDTVVARVGVENVRFDIVDGSTLSIVDRGLQDFTGEETQQILHRTGISVWLYENETQGLGPYTPETQDTAETGSSIAESGVKEIRETDKTLQSISTVEQVADRNLRNRYKDIESIRVTPGRDQTVKDISLGDDIEIIDQSGTGLDDVYRVVGIDFVRGGAGQGTEFICVNRPRRLVERLSEIEQDRDTLNAHMQGATNVNGESFTDNCDADNPLTNDVYIPSDVVKINKVGLAFKRQSFRGYVQNQAHSHSIDDVDVSHTHSVEVEPHDHELTINALNVQSLNRGTEDVQPLILTATQSTSSTLDTNPTTDIEYNTQLATTEVVGDAGEDTHEHGFPSSTGATHDVTIDYDFEHTHAVPNEYILDVGIIDILQQDTDISEENLEVGVDVQEQTIIIDDTTKEAGEPAYGIFEPANEPDIDVEVYVDGNLVDTVSNLSVGDEVDGEIRLEQDLGDPLTGSYHEIELVPVDNGGGENGRSRLQADVFLKFFVESGL